MNTNNNFQTIKTNNDKSEILTANCQYGTHLSLRGLAEKARARKKALKDELGKTYVTCSEVEAKEDEYTKAKYIWWRRLILRAANMIEFNKGKQMEDDSGSVSKTDVIAKGCPKDEEIEIFVQTICNKMLKFNISGTTTVKELHEKLYKRTRVPTELWYILYETKVIDLMKNSFMPVKNLFNIQSNSTLFQKYRHIGGAKDKTTIAAIRIQKIYRGYSIRNHIKFEGIRTAIAAIRTGRAEPNYQACNLLALRAFLTVPKVFLVFEKENVIALILKLMHLHQADLNIQRHGCYIMMMYFDYCNFTKSCINKIQKSIGTIDICSVIERLIEAMNNHTDNIDIQSCACKVLIDISLSFGVKQDHIASLGGLQCIIAAMNHFEHLLLSRQTLMRGLDHCWNCLKMARHACHESLGTLVL